MELSCSSAGAETTYTALSWWALAMITRPEIQRRAPAELDSVVGRSRVPSFSDVPSLPYIQAIVKEVLRWRPPLRFQSHVARQQTTGTTECSSRNEQFAFRIFGNATMILRPMVTTRRGSIQGGSSILVARLSLDLQRRAARDTSRSGSGIGNHVGNDSLFIFIATTL